MSLDLPRALSALFLSFQYAVGVSQSIHPFPSLRQASRLIPPISSSAHAVAITDVDLKIPLKAADDAVISAVTGGMMATEETGTYILKPYRSPKSKKLRTAVVFVPRLSHFDIENERSNNNEFRVRLHSPPFIRATTTQHRTDLCDLCYYTNRGSSHSFGSRSSYGRSARTCEA